MQYREQRVWKWQRCAPPRRTLHDCGGYVCTSYSPDLSGHIRPDKPSDSNRIGCVSQRKGYLPDNTDSGNEGEPRRKLVALQSATPRFVFVGVGVSCPSDLSFVCLSVASSGFIPCACCVMRRSDVCPYNVIVWHRQNEPVDIHL